MPQSLTYPLRQGGENLRSVEVYFEGGLDLTQAIFESRPGCASRLINYEASLTGGYRRIDGYTKYSSTIVPGQGSVFGVAVFYPTYIMAARRDASAGGEYNIYRGTGTSWTKVNPTTQTVTGSITNGSANVTGLSVNTNTMCVGQPISGTGITAGTRIATITGAATLTMSAVATATNAAASLTFTNPLSYSAGMFITNWQYNWTGTNRIIFTDGVNPAYKYDGTTFTVLYKGPSNPQWVNEKSHYLFLAGYTSNKGAVTISAPLDDTDYTPVDGAAEVVIGEEISGLHSWRESLIIFNKKGIKRIIGNSTDANSAQPFTVQEITDNIGCLDGKTINEIDGDLIFLAQDGLRTISGTAKIGDTETGSISRPIQSLVQAINPVTTPCYAMVVHRKTQYRLFYPTAVANTSRGIIGAIRRFRDGSEGWEWGELRGIQPASCASGYLSDDAEYVLHGGTDGYVYREESGNTFDGTAIGEIFVTVPLELGDLGYRKAVQRITLYSFSEGGDVSLYLAPIYNLGDASTIQPLPYSMHSTGNVFYWDASASSYGAALYSSTGTPVFRQSVQGSGFIVQLQITPNNNTTPYVIHGAYIEFYLAGRR